MSQDSEHRQARLAKWELIREQGADLRWDRFERSHGLDAARALPEDTPDVAVAGRIMTQRIMGKLAFLTLQDQSGRCQVSISAGDVGTDRYKQLKKTLDPGDFLAVRGTTYVTRMGEPTVAASEVRLLNKTLLPLPAKFHGLTDRETLYRKRYLDMIANRDTLERFLLRSRFVSVLRRYLEEHDFVEVETPVLSNVASGASARPFITHHNAMDMDVYLRIAPEMYLKRCVAGGIERVFEVARCFRNEGMAPTHLQDFTMLEYYAAYWNYEDNMAFTQGLVQHAVQQMLGTSQVEIRGETIDFSGEWPRVSFRELLIADCGIDIDEHPTVASLRGAIEAAGIRLEEIDGLGRGNLIDKLYKQVSRPKLVQPTFLVKHPIDLSPLARRNDEDPNVADRFQLLVAGWEVVNAYSELVDPVDQRERLAEQALLKSGGDEEAMAMDEDYLTAMEHGMPPMSGWGMGIDRFVALITGCENLRDVVLFPLMRPLAEGEAEGAEDDAAAADGEVQAGS